MHQTRSEAIRALPLPRKGTKYVARGLSHAHSGVPVVIAVRDMLGFAKTAREVREMVKQKIIKINGKEVKDFREAIRLFNILSIGKNYKLTILPTGRFSLDETKENFRLCKVTGKKTLSGKKTQINLHDGTNLLSKEKVSVGDSFEIDFEGKIKKIIKMAKGNEAFVISGRSIGHSGKIKEIEKSNVTLHLENGKEVELDKSHLMII